MHLVDAGSSTHCAVVAVIGEFIGQIKQSSSRKGGLGVLCICIEGTDYGALRGEHKGSSFGRETTQDMLLMQRMTVAAMHPSGIHAQDMLLLAN